MTTTASPGYLIRCTYHRYAGEPTNRARVEYFGQHFAEFGHDTAAPLLSFATRDAARAVIAAAESERYTLGNGECSRPALRVVPATAAPQWLRDFYGL